MLVKKTHPDATLPKAATAGSVLDLFSCVDTFILCGTQEAIDTGISMAIPPGSVGLICDKSSFGLSGIKVMGGVIDSDYRGNILVLLRNHYFKDFKITKGQKIANMLILLLGDLSIEEGELDVTTRTGGFGSTGK